MIVLLRGQEMEVCVTKKMGLVTVYLDGVDEGGKILQVSLNSHHKNKLNHSNSMLLAMAIYYMSI